MAKTAIYLNFSRNTEEAFTFYKSVFKTEFSGSIMRMKDAPEDPNKPLAEEDKELVMNVSLPLPGGVDLMGTDAPESMGFTVQQGNNVYIMIMPDSKAEADRLFAELSTGGKVEMPMTDMFWGDYFGSCVDKFGIRWMIDIESGKE